MAKEETIKKLQDAGVDVSLTDKGEIRVELLGLALAGVKAKGDAEASEATIKALMARIDELEKKKTPAKNAGLIFHKESKKSYRLKHTSTFRGQKLSAEILNENQKLLSDLIESGSPILVEEKED